MLKKFFVTLLLSTFIFNSTGFAQIGINYKNYNKNPNISSGKLNAIFSFDSPHEQIDSFNDEEIYSKENIFKGLTTKEIKYFPKGLMKKNDVWPLGKNLDGTDSEGNGKSYLDNNQGISGKINISGEGNDYGYTATKFQIPLDREAFYLGDYWPSTNEDNTEDGKIDSLSFANSDDGKDSNEFVGHTTDLRFQLYDFKAVSRDQSNKFYDTGYYDFMGGNDLTAGDKLIHGRADRKDIMDKNLESIYGSGNEPDTVSFEAASVSYNNDSSQYDDAFPRPLQGIGMEIYYENPYTHKRVSFDYEMQTGNVVEDDRDQDGVGTDIYDYKQIGHRIGYPIVNKICYKQPKMNNGGADLRVDGKNGDFFYTLKKLNNADEAKEGTARKIETLDSTKDIRYENDNNYIPFDEQYRYDETGTKIDCKDTGEFGSYYYRNVITSFEEDIIKEGQWNWSKEIRLKFTPEKIAELRAVIGEGTKEEPNLTGYHKNEKNVNKLGVELDTFREEKNINLTVKVFPVGRSYEDAKKGYTDYKSQKIYEYAYISDPVMGMVDMHGNIMKYNDSHDPKVYMEPIIMPTVGMSAWYGAAFEGIAFGKDIKGEVGNLNDIYTVLSSANFTGSDEDPDRNKVGYGRLTPLQSHYISEFGGFNSIQLQRKNYSITEEYMDLGGTDGENIGDAGRALETFVPFTVSKGSNKFGVMVVDMDSKGAETDIENNTDDDSEDNDLKKATPAVDFGLSIYKFQRGAFPTEQQLANGEISTDRKKIKEGKMTAFMTSTETADSFLKSINDRNCSDSSNCFYPPICRDSLINDKQNDPGYNVCKNSEDKYIYKTKIIKQSDVDPIEYNKNTKIKVDTSNSNLIDGLSQHEKPLTDFIFQDRSIGINKIAPDTGSEPDYRYRNGQVFFKGKTNSIGTNDETNNDNFKANEFGFSAAKVRQTIYNDMSYTPKFEGDTLTTYGIGIFSQSLMSIMDNDDLETYFGKSCADDYKSGDAGLMKTAEENCTLIREYSGYFVVHAPQNNETDGNAISFAYGFTTFEPEAVDTKAVNVGMNKNAICTYYDSDPSSDTDDLIPLNFKSDCSDIKIQGLGTFGQAFENKDLSDKTDEYSLDKSFIEHHNNIDEDNDIRNPTTQLNSGETGYITMQNGCPDSNPSCANNIDNYVFIAKVQVTNIDPFESNYMNIKLTAPKSRNGMDFNTGVNFYKLKSDGSGIELNDEGNFSPGFELTNKYGLDDDGDGIPDQLSEVTNFKEIPGTVSKFYDKHNGDTFKTLYPITTSYPTGGGSADRDPILYKNGYYYTDSSIVNPLDGTASFEGKEVEFKPYLFDTSDKCSYTYNVGLNGCIKDKTTGGPLLKDNGTCYYPNGDGTSGDSEVNGNNCTKTDPSYARIYHNGEGSYKRDYNSDPYTYSGFNNTAFFEVPFKFKPIPVDDLNDYIIEAKKGPDSGKTDLRQGESLISTSTDNRLYTLNNFYFKKRYYGEAGLTDGEYFDSLPRSYSWDNTSGHNLKIGEGVDGGEYLASKFNTINLEVSGLYAQEYTTGGNKVYKEYSGPTGNFAGISKLSLFIGIDESKVNGTSSSNIGKLNITLKDKETTDFEIDSTNTRDTGNANTDIRGVFTNLCVDNSGTKTITGVKVGGISGEIIEGLKVSKDGTTYDKTIDRTAGTFANEIDFGDLTAGEEKCLTDSDRNNKFIIETDLARTGELFKYTFGGTATDNDGNTITGTSDEVIYSIKGTDTTCNGDIKTDPGCKKRDFSISTQPGSCIDYGSTYEYGIKILNGIVDPVYNVEVELSLDKHLDYKGGNFYLDRTTSTHNIYKRKIASLDGESVDSNTSFEIQPNSTSEEGNVYSNYITIIGQEENGTDPITYSNITFDSSPMTVNSIVCSYDKTPGVDGVPLTDYSSENIERDFITLQIMHGISGDDSSSENLNGGTIKQIPENGFKSGGDSINGYKQYPGLNGLGNGINSIDYKTCSLYNTVSNLNPNLATERTVKINYFRVQPDDVAKNDDTKRISYNENVRSQDWGDKRAYDSGSPTSSSGDYHPNDGLAEYATKVVYRDSKIERKVTIPCELDLSGTPSQSFKGSDFGDLTITRDSNNSCGIKKGPNGTSKEMFETTYSIIQELKSTGDEYPTSDLPPNYSASYDSTREGIYDKLVNGYYSENDNIQKRLEGVTFEEDEQKEKTETFKFLTVTVKPVPGVSVDAEREADYYDKYIKASGTLKSTRDYREVYDLADDVMPAKGYYYSGAGCGRSGRRYNAAGAKPKGEERAGRTYDTGSCCRHRCSRHGGCRCVANTRRDENRKVAERDYHWDKSTGSSDLEIVAKGTMYSGTVGLKDDNWEKGTIESANTTSTLLNESGVLLDVCGAGVAMCVIGGDVYTTGSFDVSGINKLENKSMEYNIYTGGGIVGDTTGKVTGSNYTGDLDYVFEDPTGDKADKLKNPKDYCDYVDPRTGESNPNLVGGVCKTTYFEDLKTGKLGTTVTLGDDTMLLDGYFNLSDKDTPTNPDKTVKAYTDGGEDITWYRKGVLNIGRDTSKNMYVTGKGTIFVDGDVYINSNIYYEDNSISDISEGTSKLDVLAIITSGNIYISPDVTFVAPILGALGTNSTVNSCGTASDVYECTSRKPLITGKIAARNFKFIRPSTNQAAYIKNDTAACREATNHLEDPTCFTEVNELSASECILDDNRDTLNTPKGIMDLRISDLKRFKLAPGDRSADRGYFNRNN